MAASNLQVRLKSRPVGWVKESDFAFTEEPVPEIGPGQVLVKNHWLSLDPYMRGRMDDAKSYAANVELGDVMVGGTAGEVIASNNPRFAVGDKVVGYFGWQDYGVSDGTGLTKADTRVVPLSAYLGPVGMPGMTAWVGLMEIGNPKPGETVAVSAASGAVGSVVGQVAKLKGCRAVGVAGGPAKCQYVVQELGFDACVDYKSPTFQDELKAATPDGVDIDFENVGGEVMDAILKRLNAHARIPLCGVVSQYNEREARPLPDPRFFLANRIRLQAFIVSEHMELWPAGLKQLGQWVAEGRIKYRETVAEGLRDAPRAFIGMLRGENFGKQLVRL